MHKTYKLRKDRLAAVAAILLIPIIFFCLCSKHDKKVKTANAKAEPVAADTTFTTTTLPVTTTVTTTTIPHIASPSCSAAALYCVDDGSLLYRDNIDERIAPASLTKLLTASAALKYLDPDDVFTVGSELSLVNPYSSLAYIWTGSRLSVRDLMTGMLMASGNDAAYTLAASAARTLEPDVEMTDLAAVRSFCKLMNETAAEIGMKNSHFTTPDGWDDPEQYTTVSDLIVLAEYVLGQPEIMDIAGAHQRDITAVSGENYSWTNSNMLLAPESDYYCKFATGLKTGTTLEAGNCLIASFELNGRKYISAVTGCDTDEERYELTLKLIDAVK